MWLSPRIVMNNFITLLTQVLPSRYFQDLWCIEFLYKYSAQAQTTSTYKVTVASKREKWPNTFGNWRLKEGWKGENNLFCNIFSLHSHKPLPFYVLLEVLLMFISRFSLPAGKITRWMRLTDCPQLTAQFCLHGRALLMPTLQLWHLPLPYSQ